MKKIKVTIDKETPSNQKLLINYQKELLNKKDMLLTLSSEIAHIQDKFELLPILNQHLNEIGVPNDISITVLSNDRKTFSRFIIDSQRKRASHKDYKLMADAKHPYPDGFFELVLKSKIPLIFKLEELMKMKVVPSYISFLYGNGIQEMISVALIDRGKDIGGFFIFSEIVRNYSEQQLKLIQGISNQIAMAVAKILAIEENNQRENEKSMLLSLSKDITSCRTLEDVLHIVKNRLAAYFQFNDTMISLNNSDNLTHNAYVYSLCKETQEQIDLIDGTRMKYFINDGIFNVIEESNGPVIFDMDELISRSNKPYYVDFWHKLQVKEIIGFPLRMNNECIGVTKLYPKAKNTFTESQLSLVQAVCSYVGIALSNIRNYEIIRRQLQEIDQYKLRLEQENSYLQEQIKTKYNHDEIIGSKNGLRNVLKLVLNVAPSDSTVLLLGETGTGKELIARAIHNSSPRRDKLMVKVNCAAIPVNLVESELFGHERGSFTGATDRKIGKFELANNSTLFLDEIGEMPFELQVKLLRAIQEKEIERVGGKAVIKTNVRIIAATSRNLLMEVEAKRFRHDLYYRLNVFPIELPPLRERKEDIPLLISHFIEKFAKQLGKKITSISPTAIKDIMLYNWPGNIRELEHLIERNILMATGDTIEEMHLPQRDTVHQLTQDDSPIKPLQQNERDHIITALKICNGKIRGPGGAAELLRIPPTTLHSKMKKLNIKRFHA